MSEDDPEPLADLAEEVASRRAERDAEDDVFAEAFEDLGHEVDADAVWETLEGDDDEATAPETDPTGGVPTERVVEKQPYCHRCPHFSDPPEMACTHEGTEILELVDSEHVRVQNCPVVAEREELEEME